jgi:hypothetical protein
MGSQTFNTDTKPTVVVNARNDVIVMGWDQPLVGVEFDDPGDATQEGSVIKIRTRGDCRINMPRAGSLLIERARDDARIEQVMGSIQVRGVGSDLRLRDVGDTIIDAVGDSLDARGVTGSLVARSVGGGAYAQKVSGNVAINAVGSSVELRDIGGRFIGDSVGGSVRLNDVELASSLSIGGSGEFRLNPAPGENYRVSAGGSINCQFADTADARVSVADGRGAREVVLGAGAASIALSAGGSVSIRNKAFEARGPSPARRNFNIVSIGSRTPLTTWASASIDLAKDLGTWAALASASPIAPARPPSARAKRRADGRIKKPPARKKSSSARPNARPGAARVGTGRGIRHRRLRQRLSRPGRPYRLAGPPARTRAI